MTDTTDTNFSDRVLTCVACHAEFTFTSGEQLFFRQRGFTNDPKKCKLCKVRTTKGTRVRIESKVVCDVCGVDTIVPFKPIQNKPVLCRECFNKGPK